MDSSILSGDARAASVKHVVNLDLTIFAQEPKLGPLKSAIRLSVANILQVDPEAVNVKAKTGERVGSIGRAEAIGCHAAVLIDK